MDEVLSEIKGKIVQGRDSHLSASEELFVWLDAVASATVVGPVLLVGTYGDKVSSKRDRHDISDYLLKNLEDKHHPLLLDSRIEFSDNKLFFFAVDNTKGISDPGIQQYRNKMQALCESSQTVNQKVPLSLLKLQDAISTLSRAPMPGEDLLLSSLRSGNDHVCYLTLKQFADIFERFCALDGPDHIGPVENNKQLRLYLDFLDMMGAVTHHNVGILNDLIVLDPFWLLEKLTTIIRDRKLHKLEIDLRLPKHERDRLYNDGKTPILRGDQNVYSSCVGILHASLLSRFWPGDKDLRLNQQIALLMIKVCF